MDREDFIERIISRHRLSEDEARYLKQDYISILDLDIDFDALFNDYLQEYNYNVAPKPAWFVQRAYEIRDLLVELPNGNKYQFSYEHPYETERQAVEAIREKFKDKKYKLFRITKKYETEKDNAGNEKGWLREKEEIF